MGRHSLELVLTRQLDLPRYSAEDETPVEAAVSGSGPAKKQCHYRWLTRHFADLLHPRTVDVRGPQYVP